MNIDPIKIFDRENCIFCKIAQKEVSANVLYEDEFVIAFADINPVSPGHTLLIPKAHHPWFYEVPKEIANEWFNRAQILAQKLKNEHKSDYIELKIVGIDVPHAHIHLIPRKRR